jgi:Zn-finger nucleic acid-binding protein
VSSPYRAPLLRACPRCRAQLEPRSVGAVSFAMCAPCRGMWLPHASVTGFLVASESELERASQVDLGRVRPEPIVLVHPLACPRCARPMKREPLARAQVTIDLCTAHGMWFDAGELRAFVSALRGANS